MKLFKYNFKKWFNLSWSEIQDVLAYAVTEKSIDELEEKQAVIQTQLNMSDNTVFAGSNEHVQNLQSVNNILGAAIISKRFNK